MGIEGLISFLDDHGLIEYINLKATYRHQVVPCDIASTLFKYRTTSTTDAEFMAKIKAFICSALMAETHVLYIFDGEAPTDKDEECRRRTEQREKSADRLEQLNEMLNNLSLSDSDLKMGVERMNMRIPEIKQLMDSENLSDKAQDFVGSGLPEEPVVDVTEQVDVTESTLLERNSERIPVGSSESALRTTLREVYEKRMTRNVKIEPRHFEMVQAYMTEHNVPWICAPNEAEAFASYLVEHQAHIFAPAILTEDSDSLTYGCVYFLSQYHPKDHTCRSISLATVLDKLAFRDFEQFRDFCILSGCDYNDRIPGWGCTKLYKQWILQDNLSLPDFLNNTVRISAEDAQSLKLERCRTLFEHFGQNSVEDRDRVLKGCFDTWLASRPWKSVYWVLVKEVELSNLSSQSDVFGLEEDRENMRVRMNWRFKPKRTLSS